MRNGLKVLTAVVMAASFAACETAEDDVEMYEAEETATPAIGTTQPGADAPLMTAQFQAGEGATESASISGTVRVFADNNAGMTGNRTGATPSTAPGQTTQDPNAATSSPATGQAQGQAAGQGFRVEVMLTGLSQGEHAWHIHRAPCGQQGPIAVAFTETPDKQGLAGNLEANETGQVEEEASVPADQLTLDQLQSGQYSLHVHAQGGENHGPTVACADLSGQGTTTTM